MKSGSNLRMPRFKGNNKNKRLSPMTLFERVREAVFRLMMIAALSKSSPDRSTSSSTVPRKCYRAADDHRSEAVAECIEFIKKKAYREENRESSSGCNSTMDVGNEVVIPVPVM